MKSFKVGFICHDYLVQQNVYIMNLWNGFFHGSKADINFLFSPQEHVARVRPGDDEETCQRGSLEIQRFY